jgi:hypothetical protein
MAVEESNIPPDELFSSEPRGSAGEQSQDEENLGTVSETVYPDAPASAEDDADSPSHVVAVGASAGGLEALERFFRAMPEKSGMAFVVIQHLSPDFKSLMDELLERFNKMPAKQVTGDVTIKPNRIYLAPPGGELSIDGRTLSTRPRSKEGGLFLLSTYSFARWPTPGVSMRFPSCCPVPVPTAPTAFSTSATPAAWSWPSPPTRRAFPGCRKA